MSIASHYPKLMLPRSLSRRYKYLARLLVKCLASLKTLRLRVVCSVSFVVVLDDLFQARTKKSLIHFKVSAITRKLCGKDSESHFCYASTHCSAACSRAIDDVTHPDLGWRATRHLGTRFQSSQNCCAPPFWHALGPERHGWPELERIEAGKTREARCGGVWRS